MNSTRQHSKRIDSEFNEGNGKANMIFFSNIQSSKSSHKINQVIIKTG